MIKEESQVDVDNTSNDNIKQMIRLLTDFSLPPDLPDELEAVAAIRVKVKFSIRANFVFRLLLSEESKHFGALDGASLQTHVLRVGVLAPGLLVRLNGFVVLLVLKPEVDP